MFAGAANAAALAVTGFGILRPAFDTSVAFDGIVALSAAIISFVLWSIATYIHAGTEEE